MTRVAVALVVALLFTTALGGVVVWWYHTEVVPARSVGPLLSARELWLLQRSTRSCSRREDCRQPLECVDGICMGQECWTDAQCEPGYLCRALSALGGATVRLCVLEGTQKEGELCDLYPLKERSGCQAGLYCNIWYCGRPCQLGEPGSCPHGQICREGVDRPSCIPYCVQTGCPTGQVCARVTADFAVCGTLDGEDCEQTPCPAGQVCVTSVDRGRGMVVRRSCARPCSEQISCPSDSACVNGYCKRS